MTHPASAVLGLAALALAPSALGLPASAQPAHDHPMPMASPASPQAGMTPANPSTDAYRAAMTAMHRNMDVPYTGNADRDFVAGMIPHHQGAVEMARIELRYGKDPVLRRLARDVIAAQDREIALMRRWQARNPAPASPTPAR